MRRTRLFWHLFISYLLITLCALSVVTWGTWWSLREFYYLQTRRDLEARAQMATVMVRQHLSSGDVPFVDARCKAAGQLAATRITVMLPSGQVIGDSEHDVSTMANHLGRPEMRQALAGKVGLAIRTSETVHHAMMYEAVPVWEGGRISGVVRASIPLTAYYETLDRLRVHLLIVVLFVALVAIITSLVIARRISRPLEDVRRVAARFARGDLQGRLPVEGMEEMAGLAEAMNQMAVQLDERIRTISRQRTEQEAMLLSMIEGVLAIDNEECILRLNQAAATFLAVDPAQVIGRSIQEAIRNTHLQKFVATVLANRDPQEAEVQLRIGDESRWVQLHGTLLHDEAERRIGALVVIHDVTRLYRLETVRRDFVANVSHELKTPITSIKGFVETLLNGSLGEPDEAERFLRIIARHADRMNEIIEDLLALSSLEQQQNETGITVEPGSIYDVVQVAMQACTVKAAAKAIRLSFTEQPDFTIPMDAALIEQAVVNLIDNAIKYSPAESTVTITLEQTEAETLIHVRDQGCGIATEHLPRIFERFYRVDTGRSRKLGGTGLGLAIVKHIVQAHQGRLTVESRVGNGSTFTIHLPKQLPASAPVLAAG